MPSLYYERQKAEFKAKDYSGHVPTTPPVVNQSPIRDLVDEMVEKSNEARERILRNLIENPGVVATFGEDFVVEFSDVRIESKHTPMDDILNEYRVELVQEWRIRRRKEEDGRPALGGDSRGEERSGGQDSGEELPEAPGLRLLP